MNMKKFIKFIKVIKRLAVAVSVLCVALSSCSEMNDLHNEYLDGEIIYAAKVDSVGVRSGKNRLILDLTLTSQRVETIRIYWNDYADSMDVAINNQVGIFSKELADMEERDYLFYLVSIDKFGNRSLPFEASGSVYGNRYQNGLTNRVILSIKATDENVTINWSGMPDNAIYSDLRYTDREGKKRTLQIPPGETATLLTNWSSIDSSRTAFLPETNALDTVYSAWRTAPAVQESTPFKGPHILSAAVPCEIYAKDFDFGGEGLAFHDSNGNNDTGASYRADNGDPAGAAADVEGGGNIGWTNAGEWLVYTVEVQDAGAYEADVYLSVNSGDGGAFAIAIDGNKSERIVAPNNGNWSAWLWAFETYPDLKPIQPKFRLSVGKHKIRFCHESGGFNWMSFKFTRISD
jgi:hypothetical protein